MPLDYLEDKDIAGNAASDILGQTGSAIVATGADLVSTLYNSTIGLVAPDISTRDILARTNENALNFYNEHEEGVQAASFLAGVIAPQAATLKLLGTLKNGAAALGKVNKFVDPAMDIFSGRKATVLETELKTLFENAKYDTPIYNQTIRRLYANKIGENVVDAAILEAFTVGTLNAHPYMEDYVQNPVSNFVLWASVGGALGAGLGAIATKTAIRKATSSIAEDATSKVFGNFIPTTKYDAAAARYQYEGTNINNLTAILKSDSNQYAKDLANSALTASRASREEALYEAASWLKPVGKDKASPYIALRPYVEDLLNDPNMFGVNKIKLPTLNFVPKSSGTTLDIEVIKDLEKGMDADTKTVFYRPATKEIFDRNLAGNAATAADLKNFTLAKKINYADPGNDFYLNNLARAESSAVVNSKYLDELNGWAKIKPEEIRSIGISPENLPRLTAAAAWQTRLTADELEVIRYNIRSDMPLYSQSVKYIQSGASGVASTHLTDLARIFGDKNYYLMERLGQSDASGMLSSWKNGDTSTLRRAFDSFFTGTRLEGNEVGNAEIAKQIWDAGAKTRQQLRQYADAEGNIRLYRGIRGDPKVHAPIEGYTLDPTIAKSFGTLRLFKVPVDNVVGRIGGSSFKGEGEILVTASHYPYLDKLDIASAKSASNEIVDLGVKDTTQTLNGLELIQHLQLETTKQIKNLVADGGFSFEEISSRLNITKEAAMLVAAGKDLAEIPNWQMYSSIDKIKDDYLNVKNRIIALQGNPNVQSQTKFLANLDDRNLATGHQQFVEITTAKYHSGLADEVLNIYNPMNDPETRQNMQQQLRLLKDKLGEINNQNVGTSKFQSVDNALRHLSTGPLITFIGKKVTDATDRAVRETIEPVSTAFRGLNNSKVALAEFNYIDNKLTSLKGWKDVRIDDESGFGYIVQRENRNGQIIEVPIKEADGRTVLIKTPEVINALQSTRDASAELLTLHNLNRELRGQPPLNDLGFYLPSKNLVNQHYSYVIDATNKQRPSILVANTAEELKGLEKAYAEEILNKNPALSIVTKSEQDKFNTIQGYMDAEPYVTYANVNLKHGGSSASVIVPSDARRVDGILQGYEQQIIASMRKYHETYLHDITSRLDIMSSFNQRLYENQPLTGFFKSKAPDAARTVKNALLGVNNLNQWTTWKSVNEFADMMIVNAGRSIDSVANTFSNKVGSKEYFEGLEKTLSTYGIKSPWESYQIYAQSQLGAASINSKRAVSAANGMLGTLQLRLMEAGHALVNALSLPILSSAALMEGLPATVLSNGTKVKMPLRIMYDAARFQFNPEGKRLIKLWEDEGYLNQAVRQYTDVIGKIHVPTASKGLANEALDALESFQNSKAVELLTKPADFTEKLTRQYAMSQGYLMAKTAYPGISDRGATIYAVSIADRVIGNYHSSQRPTLFQGTFGAMLGLYQTYMLTFAQSVYRGLETRNLPQIASTMLTQAGLFGTASWPGYDTLSKFIGLHMSNDNYDLTTGTYRAVGDTMAELVLYGLPSWLGPSLYTRGDVNPRFPQGLQDLPIVNTLNGVFNALGGMYIGLTSQPELGGKLQAMMEALSLQTMSRPIARASEIISGESITKKGQTVSTSDDVWTFNGVFSRLLAVRPLEEQVTRNALNLHSFYGAADYDNRQKAVGLLRTAIRAGDMSDDLVEKVAESYLSHGGSAKGWNSVMNEIMTRTEEGTSYDLLRKLEPNSPLRRMIKDTF